MSIIDLNQKPEGHEVSVSIQKEISKAEKGVALFKEVVTFLLCVGLAISAFVYCAGIVTDDTSSDDAKRFAMSILSGAIGGIVGYLLKK